MTVRFSVTLKLHGVPTVRHIRDIEESLRLFARRLCCVAADSLHIVAEEEVAIERADRYDVGSETNPAALERIA